MPEARIPFGFEESGESQLAGGNVLAFNVLIDGKGAVRRRPGMWDYAGVVVDEAGVSGLHLTNGGLLFAVGARPTPPRLRSVYRVTMGAAADITAGVPGQDVDGDLPATFAETEGLLCIAGGGRVQKVTLTDPATPSARLGGSPPRASHVVAQSSRLLTNSMDVPRTRVAFSEPGIGTVTAPFETWSGSLASGEVHARMRPEPVIALHENTNEVWAFSRTGVQVFVTDPVSGYAEARFRERGLAAPYSVIKVNEAFMWIDHEKRVIVSDANEHKVLSGPIQAVLDDIDVTDAIGYRLDVGQWDAAVWEFPSAGITLCYQSGGGWSRWARWDGKWLPMGVRCALKRWDDKANLVGLADGRIGQYHPRAGGDIGLARRAHCMTGYLSRGTDARKQCNAVILTFDVAHGRVGQLRWRDEDGPWREWLGVNVRGRVAEFRGMGTYRRRQWELMFDTAIPADLVSASEEFVVT